MDSFQSLPGGPPSLRHPDRLDEPKNSNFCMSFIWLCSRESTTIAYKDKSDIVSRSWNLVHVYSSSLPPVLDILKLCLDESSKSAPKQFRHPAGLTSGPCWEKVTPGPKS